MRFLMLVAWLLLSTAQNSSQTQPPQEPQQSEAPQQTEETKSAQEPPSVQEPPSAQAPQEAEPSQKAPQVTCPVWTCEKAEAEKCLSYSKDKSTAYAARNCAKPDNVCYLGDSALKPQQDLPCHYPGNYKQLQDDIYKDYRYCTKNLWQHLNCPEYCRSDRKWNKDLKRHEEKWTCSRYRFLYSMKQNPEGAQGWAECSADSECMSGMCKCAPGTTGKGRCSTSKDEGGIWAQLFQQVCENNKRESSWVWSDQQCALFIQIQQGHVIKGIQENNDTLPCLANFDDTKMLLLASEATALKWYQVLIGVIIGACCCVCIYFRDRLRSSRNPLRECLLR